jgi:DNA-binding GntR family transcriptional regulator
VLVLHRNPYSRLEENLKEQEQEVAKGDLISFFLKDNEFHRILFTACKKETVFDAIGFYMPHFTRERMLRLQMFDTGELLCDHRNILEAIRRGDCRTAKMHLSEHLDHVMCDQQILLEGYPDYFILWSTRGLLSIPAVPVPALL